MTLYNQAYKQSGSFRFRKEAGEIQMARARRSFEKIKAVAAANPGDAEAQQKLEKASKQFDKLQIDELKLQVENYPTDLSLKYKLGIILYERGEYNEAIEQFQLRAERSQDPPERAEPHGQVIPETRRLGRRRDHDPGAGTRITG